jgi:hypothetical protein
MNEQELPRKRQEADRLLGLLGIGIIIAIFTFWLDQPFYRWINTHEVKSLKDVAGWLSKYGDTPELMFIGLAALRAPILRLRSNRLR